MRCFQGSFCHNPSCLATSHLLRFRSDQCRGTCEQQIGLSAEQLGQVVEIGGSVCTNVVDRLLGVCSGATRRLRRFYVGRWKYFSCPSPTRDLQLSTGGGGEQGVQRHTGGVHALGGGGEGQDRARDTCIQVTSKSKSKRETEREKDIKCKTNVWGVKCASGNV